MCCLHLIINIIRVLSSRVFFCRLCQGRMLAQLFGRRRRKARFSAKINTAGVKTRRLVYNREYAPLYSMRVWETPPFLALHSPTSLEQQSGLAPASSSKTKIWCYYAAAAETTRTGPLLWTALSPLLTVSRYFKEHVAWNDVAEICLSRSTYLGILSVNRGFQHTISLLFNFTIHSKLSSRELSVNCFNLASTWGGINTRRSETGCRMLDYSFGNDQNKGSSLVKLDFVPEIFMQSSILLHSSYCIEGSIDTETGSIIAFRPLWLHRRP